MNDAGRARIEEHLRRLTEHPDRHLGGPGNGAATDYFAEEAAGLGFEVARRAFECVEWEAGGVTLEAGGESFEAFPGPYSLPCRTRATLVAASSVEELESASLAGAVALLHGPIAEHQLMPKNFVFYNPEEHKRIVRALEAGTPAAVVAATGRDPGLVGGGHPFPLFEDGDFDIPNAYMRDSDGERLLGHAGELVALDIRSRRLPRTAEQVTATMRGRGRGRIVAFAHIDSRRGSPGALDNASGVAALLGMMGLLAREPAGPALEVVPLNGEDDYANPGEMLWWRENQGRFGEILLGLNVDGAGLTGHGTEVSSYGLPERIAAHVREAVRARPGFGEGPPWVQGDHTMFTMNSVPAVAVTSAGAGEFMERYAHTERDALVLADAGIVAQVSSFLADLIGRVSARH